MKFPHIQLVAAVILAVCSTQVSAVPISIDYTFSPITVSFNGTVQSTGDIAMSIHTDTSNPNLGFSFGDFANAYAADVFFTAPTLGLNNTRVTSPTTLYFGTSVVGFSAGLQQFGTIFTAFIDNNLSFGSAFDLSTLIVPQGPIVKRGTEFRTQSGAITFENGSFFDAGAFTSFGDQRNTVRVSLRDVTDVPEPTSLALVGLGLAGFCRARRKAA